MVDMKNKKITRGSKPLINSIMIILILFISSLQGIAQDYSTQIDVFAKSFAEKNVSALSLHTSAELKFDPVPVANTLTILKSIVSQLPKLNSMTILESENGKAKVKYDFDGLGISESYLFFNDSGKITRIEFIENLIKQQMAVQQRQQKSVQVPNPSEFGAKYKPSKVEFVSIDGLTVYGDIYEIDKNKPVILLCHQADYNRIEYADIAPRLNELGYNCLAIDQRSGGEFGGKINDTAKRAGEKGMTPTMVDAQQDIAAAVRYLNKAYKTKVIVWGSSYSSSLALFEGVSNSNIKAIIGFSPGDYFGNAAPSLSTIFSKIAKPYLVTSSKVEAEALRVLIGDSKQKKNQQQFVPKSEGFHGSRALWTGQEGSEEYWNVVTQFLTEIN